MVREQAIRADVHGARFQCPLDRPFECLEVCVLQQQPHPSHTTVPDVEYHPSRSISSCTRYANRLLLLARSVNIGPVPFNCPRSNASKSASFSSSRILPTPRFQTWSIIPPGAYRAVRGMPIAYSYSPEVSILDLSRLIAPPGAYRAVRGMPIAYSYSPEVSILDLSRLIAPIALSRLIARLIALVQLPSFNCPGPGACRTNLTDVRAVSDR